MGAVLAGTKTVLSLHAIQTRKAWTNGDFAAQPPNGFSLRFAT